MMKSVFTTVRGVRALRNADVRELAREVLDDALLAAVYARRASGMARALPMLGAFGAGFAMGAGVGVLFAPKSGSETRRALRRRLDELMAKVREAAKADGASTIITDEHELRGL